MTKPNSVAKPDFKLDAEEQALLDAFEAGEVKSVSPSKASLAKFKAAASATFIKDKRINIRLSSPDLMDIQARALEEGLPYQTFIASILHGYLGSKYTGYSHKMHQNRIKVTCKIPARRYDAKIGASSHLQRQQFNVMSCIVLSISV